MTILNSWGPFGLVAVFWYLDAKEHRRTLAYYRQDTQAMKQMYSDNVQLVRQYERLALGLNDQIVMTTQVLTQLTDKIQDIQCAPNADLLREIKGKIEGLT